jgi:prefoldin subunit 5
MVYITKPIEIISSDMTINDELDVQKLSGNFSFVLADSTDKDSVVDVKIGDNLIGWLTKEDAMELAKTVVEQLTPFIEAKKEAP